MRKKYYHSLFVYVLFYVAVGSLEQLSYYLKAFQLFRKAEWMVKRGVEDCTCKVCRNQKALGRQQLRDCTSFSDAVHASDFCSKDDERGCRPLRCALGECEHCKIYEDAIHICPREHTTKRMVRYKTKEPVSSGGKVFEDWVYKELNFKSFWKLLKDFFLEKYRYGFMLNWTDKS